MSTLLKLLPLLLATSSLSAQELNNIPDANTLPTTGVYWQSEKEQFIAYNSCTGEELKTELPKLITSISTDVVNPNDLSEFVIYIGDAEVRATVVDGTKYYFENLVGEPKEYKSFGLEDKPDVGGVFSIETYPNLFFYGNPELVDGVKINLFYKNGDIKSLYSKGLPVGAAFSEMFDEIPVYDFNAKLEDGLIKSKLRSDQQGDVRITYQYSFGRGMQTQSIVVKNDVAKGTFEFPVSMLKGYEPNTLARLVVAYSSAVDNSKDLTGTKSSSTVELFDINKMWFFDGIKQDTTCNQD